MHGANPDSAIQRAVGDGLVPVASALGRGASGSGGLRFPAAHTRIITHTDHLALLGHPDVYLQLREWLSGPA